MATVTLTINDTAYSVSVKRMSRDSATVEVNGEDYEVEISREPGSAPQPTSAPPSPAATAPAAIPAAAARPAVAGGSGEIRAPMPGKIIDVLVGVGDIVKAGDKVLRMEAMKMENEIFAPVDGSVTEVAVQEGKDVEEGQLLVVIG
jgi:biotin carboxyl carrier protein